MELLDGATLDYVSESWAAYYLYKKNQWAHKPVANWFIEMWSTLLNKAYLEIDGVIPTDARLSNPIKLQRKTHPWPIMTAIDASQQPNDSTWFEFTPAQVTKIDLISENWVGVETASFGCEIDDKGIKLPSPTGDEFAQLMAIWGSAPALTGEQFAAMSSSDFSMSSLFFLNISLARITLHLHLNFPTLNNQDPNLHCGMLEFVLMFQYLHFYKKKEMLMLLLFWMFLKIFMMNLLKL